MKQNFILIYTGDGKGKTTAALGLAIRAIGAGKKIAMVQFMKKGNFSEIKTIKKYQIDDSAHNQEIAWFESRHDYKNY